MQKCNLTEIKVANGEWGGIVKAISPFLIADILCCNVLKKLSLAKRK